MEITYTKHALKRLQERNISTKKLTQTILDPDIFSDEGEDISIAYKVYGHLALKVVYQEEGETKRVITTHWIAKERLKTVKPIVKGDI